MPPPLEEYAEEARVVCRRSTRQDILRQAFRSLWTLTARLMYPYTPRAPHTNVRLQ